MGVITEHHRREGPSWLTAVRIDRCINAADEDRDRLTRLLGIPSGALELPEATDLQSIGSADEYGALLQILREAIGNKISSEEIGGQAVSSGVQSPPALYQLPSKVSDFIGRIAELNELRQHLLSWQDRSPAGVRISAISGKPGVGKSALAIQLANDLADEFSDGQLYVDLYGEEDNQLKPADVLIQFLKSLGISGAESDGETLGLLQARYRSALAHRRVLVVLDNAIDAAQVEPLIPTGKGCAVIVTSRPPLALLEGAHLLSLGVLSTDEAVHLLCSVSGRSETAEDSATLIRIAELCGNLPLALRIAAAKLKGRPHWSLARLADRLTDERRRLDELRLGHREVRASFRLSYSDLDNEASRAFRLLGLVPGKDFAPQALIPLLGLADVAADKDSGILRQVEDLVEQLVDAQLLETTPQRYKFHDLWGSRIWSPALSSSFMLPVRTR